MRALLIGIGALSGFVAGTTTISMAQYTGGDKSTAGKKAAKSEG
ncbi:MAG TPA: hypothetical protein VIX19_05820 [Terriglobales bacterium]